MKIAIMNKSSYYSQSIDFEFDAGNEKEVDIFNKYAFLAINGEDKRYPTDASKSDGNMENPRFDTSKFAKDFEEHLGKQTLRAME